MEALNNERLKEKYIGQKTAEILAIDYDENQFLVKEFSDKSGHPRREALPDVKCQSL